MTDNLKLGTRSILWMAARMRKHWPRGKCHFTRQDIAAEIRSARRHNDHRLMRSHYMAGAALYGVIG